MPCRWIPPALILHTIPWRHTLITSPWAPIYPQQLQRGIRSTAGALNLRRKACLQVRDRCIRFMSFLTVARYLMSTLPIVALLGLNGHGHGHGREQNNWDLLASSKRHSSQSVSPHNPQVALPQPSTSMNVPSLTFYDPANVGNQQIGDYEQWIQQHYLGQLQSQEQYAVHGQMDGMTGITYDGPALPQHQQQQQHPSMSASMSTPIASAGTMQQQHMQNRYSFVPSQYMNPQQEQAGPSYGQSYGQTRPQPQARSVIAPRIARHVPRGSDVPLDGYATQHQQQTIARPTPSAIHPAAYQRSQYAQNPQQESIADVSYFPSTSATELVQEVSVPQQNREFTFHYQHSPDQHLTPGSNPSYTPNSETNPLPPSASPSSWVGTDDSQSQPPQQFTTFVSVQGPPKSPPVRRAGPSAASKPRGRKRARIDQTAASDSGSDDEDNVPMGLPPLRGPDSNPARLYVTPFVLCVGLTHLDLLFLPTCLMSCTARSNDECIVP